MSETTLDMIRTIDLNLFAVLVLLVIGVYAILNPEERSSISTRLFELLIMNCIVLAVLDSIGWIVNGKYVMLNFVVNSLSFFFLPFPSAIWLMYVHYQLFGSKKHMMRLLHALSPILAFNGAMTFASIWTGWYFSISADNRYSRGPFFWVHVVIAFGLLAISFAMIWQYKSAQDPKLHRTLLLFIVPPLAGAFLQSLFYGLSLTWASITISILIVFLGIQNRGLNIDSLTGTYNRRHFERIITNKISRSKHDGFSVIICDLDNFKQINDCYGHDVGDEALQQAVALLRQALRKDDLIARLGGDEFYVVLDIDDDEMLQRRVKGIAHIFEKHSKDSSRPYQLSVSMGAAVYDQAKDQSAEAFLRRVDQLMYQEKNRRQTLSGPKE